jgi:hypothetical protein
MQTPVRAAAAAAAIVGAGLAGFGLTSALAQTDDEDPTTTTEAPAADDAAPDDAPEGAGCIGHGAGLEAMAETIGIEVDELRAALEEGQTPAEVAEANGVSREYLVAALVEEINTHLDEAVENGDLTEVEADERRAEVEDHANDIVDGVRPEGGLRMGPGGPPPFAEDGADATGTATVAA